MLTSEVLELYINECTFRGLKEKTVIQYKQYLDCLIQFVGDIPICEMSEKNITDFGVSLYKKNKVNPYHDFNCNLSKETIRSYILQLRIFFRWTDKKGYTQLGDFIKLPRHSKRLVAIYSDNEIRAIYNSINNTVDWLRYRNYTLISLFLDSGLRSNEACTLLIENVYFERNVIKVSGKGDKDRYVPLGSLTKKYMLKYLSICPSHGYKTVFISYRLEPLTPNAVENIFYRIRKKTKFKICAHKLRHNFATNWLINQYASTGKADVYQLMMILGHSDVKTTQIYVHMAQQIVLGMNSYSKVDSLASSLPRVT